MLQNSNITPDIKILKVISFSGNLIAQPKKYCSREISKGAVFWLYPPYYLFLNFISILYMSECFAACMSVYHLHALCKRRSEEGAGSPETGVTDGLAMQVLRKSSQCSLLNNLSLAP